MNVFENFLSQTISKIGAKGAFDLSRDAKISGLVNLLIEKGITTKEEVERFQDGALMQLGNQIASMPPIPVTK